MHASAGLSAGTCDALSKPQLPLPQAFGVAISRVPPSAVVWDSLVPGCASENESLEQVLAAIPPYADASARIVADVTRSFTERHLEDHREA